MRREDFVARPLDRGKVVEIETTLARLLARNAASHPQGVAIREKSRGIWQETTWSQFLDATLAFGAGLEALGFVAGNALLILGDNRPRLYQGMLATGMLRGHALPVYPDATPQEVQRFIENGHAHLALAEDQEQVDKLLELRHSGVRIDSIIYDEPRGIASYHEPGLLAWNDVAEIGFQRLASSPGLRSSLIERGDPSDPAVLVHSSGTTGHPKGILLSQRNVLAAVRSGFMGGAFGHGDSLLAYFPIAWVGDFVVTIGAGISLQFTVNLPESQETVSHDLREIAPTFYLATPRSWDNMMTSIHVRMEDSTWLKKRLYNYFIAAAVSIERNKLVGQLPTLGERIVRSLGELLVLGPIKDQIGLTRVARAFTGGEAIGEDTFLFYRALGIKLRQIYGQTESSALIALQNIDEVRLHTVGRPLPGVEVRIDDQGEIMIRGENVFSGYFENAEATNQALEGEWLHTGDAGYLEDDGHLVVLGRVSEVVRTSQGERFIPNYIENRLKFSPYIKDVAVFGRGRETLAALVCIDRDAVGHWAELNGISYMSYADLSQNASVHELVRAAIERVNKTLTEALRIRRFVCLHKEFDPDDGEITRTRKLRRNYVETVYVPIIEAIYDGRASVTMQAKITYESGASGTIARTLTVQEL